MSTQLSAATFVYVSKLAEKQLQVFRLDRADGSLHEIESHALDVGPGALSFDSTKRFLFASLRGNASVASFAVDAKTGRLKSLGTASLVVPQSAGAKPGPADVNASFLRPDRAGRWLVSSSYNGGRVAVQTLEGGKVGSPPVQVIETVTTAHCVAFDPSERWAFVPHVKPNAVYQFRFDAATGKLTAAGQAAGGAPGAGPRHIAFHPTLPRAFTSDETGSSITAYAFDAEKGLMPEQTVSTLPADAKGMKNTTAEVKVHPSGRFVWVSNRGHDTLAGFAIDDAGKLTAIDRTPTEKTTRSFDIEPRGEFLLAAGEGSGNVAVYRIETKSGRLDRLHVYPLGKSAFWVSAIELAE